MVGGTVELDPEHVVPNWCNLLSTGTDPPANVGLVGGRVTVHHSVKLVGRVCLHGCVVLQFPIVEIT